MNFRRIRPTFFKFIYYRSIKIHMASLHQKTPPCTVAAAELFIIFMPPLQRLGARGIIFSGCPSVRLIGHYPGDRPTNHLLCFPSCIRSRLNWILGQRLNPRSAGISGSHGPENEVARWRRPNSEIRSQNDNFGLASIWHDISISWHGGKEL